VSEIIEPPKVEPPQEPKKDESSGCLAKFIGTTVSAIIFALGYYLVKYFFGR